MLGHSSTTDKILQYHNHLCSSSKVMQDCLATMGSDGGFCNIRGGDLRSYRKGYPNRTRGLVLREQIHVM